MRNCWKMRILRTPCASLTRWNPNARISRPMRSRGASAVIPCSRLCTGRTSVPWNGESSVRCSAARPRCAPAAEAFQRIDAAWKLRPADPELNSYFSPIYGYFWRAIAKTNRLSPHSFGIAVDLNPDKGPYWQWSKLRPHPLQKTFPSAIVSLFEDNGFIWGGKWEHFDLMHFEYRPELIIKAKKLRAQANGEKPEDAS